MKAWRASMLGAVVAAACAHVEPPPGGPEDRTPPSVVNTEPAAEAVVSSYDGPVVFQFDERISETGVDDAVLVSPRTSPVEVSRGRTEVRVSLRNGWEPGVIYQVTLQPRIRDLFNNPLAGPVQLVFSTGPPIPATRVAGTVIDRETGRPAPDHRVEAIRLADSLVYAAATDREGAFEITRIPEGEYSVRAFEDVNRNRVLEPYEARDTARAVVAADTTVSVALRVLAPDSTGPLIESVEARDRIVEIEFDDYLDPAQSVDPSQVTIAHPVDGPLPISRAAAGQLPPADTAATPPAPGPAEAGAEASAAPGRVLQAELVEGTALEPGVEYGVTVRGIRNLNGVAGDAEGTLEVEPPPDR